VLLLAPEATLLVLSETGEVILLAADPQGSRELTRYPAVEGKTWNHPIIVGRRLFVCNGEEAACFDLVPDPGSADSAN
jgi:outer membrane protein assembly factor BamB